MIDIKPYTTKLNEFKNALELIKALKNIYVKNQDYEAAAKLRDQEKKTLTDIESVENQIQRIRNRSENLDFGHYIALTFTLEKGVFYLNDDTSKATPYTVDDVHLFYIEDLNKVENKTFIKRKIEINKLVDELKTKFTTLNDKLENDILKNKDILEGSDWQIMQGGKLTTTDDSNVQQLTPGGKWVKATPISMKCEHDNCPSTTGREYKRKATGSSWDGEPIFLCDNHNHGYEPLST